MYVIAGASGHVGSVAAKELLARKQQVRVVVRDAAKGAAWSREGAEVAVGSLDDAAFITEALKGAKGFFVLVPPPPFTTADFYASQRKVSDAVIAGVKASAGVHVVLLSSIGAELAEGNGPIKGLHYLENGLRAIGGGTLLTALRASYFQENLGSAVAAARQGKYYNFLPSADAAFPQIATVDLGKVAAQELLRATSSHEAVDVIGPSYAPRQVAEKLGAAVGRPLEIVNVPAAAHFDALTQAGMPKPYAEVYVEMFAGFASGKIRPAGTRRVEGRTPIDETIKKLV